MRHTKQVLLTAVLSVVLPYTVGAATVRGQVICSGGNPAALTSHYATVFRGDVGRSKQAPVGSDGKFYLYNVPPGKFALELWLQNNPSTPPKVFEIIVKDPYTDVPSVAIPC